MLPWQVQLPALPDKRARAPRRRTCLRCAGLAKAREQLEVVGRVLVWLLRVANPALAAAGQPQLRGVMAVQGALAAKEEREGQGELDVSCASLGATAGAKMKLDVWPF